MSKEKKELIGEGLQYFVYDVGDQRVRKVAKNREEMKEYLSTWYISEEKKRHNLEKALRRRQKAVQELRSNQGSFNSIFGNLKFEGKDAYQDRVTPTKEVLGSEDIEGGKKVIDDYIELIKKMWRLGIGDTIYNFTINTGYNDEGEMIQLDFGEIVFSKERVKKEVRDQKWLNKWSYNEHLDQELKQYFKKRMSDELNVDLLDSIWDDKKFQ